jgi:NitT/TauT family transport system permease protein
MNVDKLWKRLLALGLLALAWQGFALWYDSPLLFPTFTDTARAFRTALTSEDQLLTYARETLFNLSVGFACGVAASTILVCIALSFGSFGEIVLETLTGLFAPLPAVSIFPLAILWFGVGMKTVVFLTGFAVLFPLTVSAYQGIRTVSPTLVNVGRNLGLRGPSLMFRVLVPGALPSILSGLRNGVTNGFRALIAVELVMGAATGSGGLGWFIMMQKQNLEIPTVFAGILSILLLASLFEILFSVLEWLTIRRWGMLR